MRFHLLGLILLVGASGPALAQGRPVATVQPEFGSVAQPQFGGVPASSAIADLTARLDALERQLAAMTGQAEENAHRVRQLERQLEQARRENDDRFQRIETRASSPVAAEAQPQPAAIEPKAPAKALAAAAAPASGDAAEDAYLVGFRQWEGKQFGEAQKSLEAMAKKYPKHPRASYALNLAGRAYLDEGKPASAAKILLSNYQTNPKGERAADSLYFLGQALMQLKKPAEACKVYEELAEVYPNMRDWLKQRLPAARKEAKCTG
ncbi:MAG TPA: tetratricopeptide repeat protein [Allosphingosinicella sp.]|nr:tetratricopeptide repeat protein [Allosphingosinicella sp.]